MKKKIVLLAAFAAVTTAFVGCSSDETLASQNATEPPVAEGIPLTVKLVDGDGTTRGTDLTATTLPSFSLYSVKNGGTERWLGTYEEGESTGATFTGDNNGTFTNSEGIVWKEGKWDFYALSDPSFASEDDGNGGTQDAEHLDDATDPHFTYTVNNNYNSQQDLLVASATEKKASDNNGTVSLQFKHALAQIGQITFKFEGLIEDNSQYFFVIKSVTLHNICSTGTYSFKDKAWSGQSQPTNYDIELPQFDLDDNGNYKIFAEDDTSEDEAAERESTGFATGTKRGTTNIPNYFQCPGAGGSFSYVMPFAKKTGSEGSSFESYNPAGATYTEDGGLYIIPQALAKTVWEKNGSGEVTGVASGVYLEVHGVVLNLPTANDWSTFDESFMGVDASRWHLTKVNNYWITQSLNQADYNVSYLIPLEKATKELEGGNLYNLTFNLAKAVTIENGGCIFDGAEIE